MVDMFALFVLALWLYLLAGRGGFWLAAQRDDRPELAAPAVWPPVTAVIPARDEAATVARTVQSVLAQDYPGRLDAVVVDDGSQDATATIAAEAAAAMGARERLTVLPGRPLPPGWAGKVWAQKQGIDTALAQAPKYLLLTDADIVYAPRALRSLIGRAENGSTVLTSVMAKLNCASLAERWFIPAFVFFFQMLYPFAWVNRRGNATAAAAGGCMLVRADALTASGGIEGIRGALIDDCALAALLKRGALGGAIWLGLADDEVVSLRDNRRLGTVWRMVARTAFTQLGHSAGMLGGALLGMALTYLAGPVAILALPLHGDPVAAAAGAGAWALSGFAYRPTLRLYGRPGWQAAGLPVAALLYGAMTAHSALAHWRGRGGAWKGRTY